MKHYFPAPSHPRRHALRIPDFHAVPGRGRCDGWTPLRQAEFIGHLAATRSVSAAAKAVSMARESAYRLRTRPWSEEFCAAWDAALGKAARPESHRPVTFPRKVTLAELQWRAESGLWRVRLVQGRYAGVLHKADNSALLSLLSRLNYDAKGKGAGGGGG